MSRLSDQVEAKIARANRAFRLSSRIIAATQLELESHGAWLDSHRASWTEEIERHRRLLNRKLATRSAGRLAVGLLFAAPFALARKLDQRKGSREALEPRYLERDPPFTREAALRRSVPCASAPSAAIATPRVSATPIAAPTPRAPLPTAKEPLRPAATTSRQAPAAAVPRADRVSPRAIAALAVFIVAAGVFRAVFLAPSSQATARLAEVAPELASPARTTLTVAKSTREIEPKTEAKTEATTEPPAARAGFAVIDAAPQPEGLRARPQTIAEMIALSEPLASSADAGEAAPPPQTETPVAPKPAPKAKPKRKVAARDEPTPWWHWSWVP